MGTTARAGGIVIREFDTVMAEGAGLTAEQGTHVVPRNVFDWLEDQCLRRNASGVQSWAKLTSRQGRRAVQVLGHVGIVFGPGKFAVEILPKIDDGDQASVTQSRRLLLDMLSSLRQFRYLHVGSASIGLARMPLLEIFVTEFLESVTHVVRRGIASQYRAEQGNLTTLRGKLLIPVQIRQNVCRRDRFYTEHDIFSIDRAENRLIRTALDVVLGWCKAPRNQRTVRELLFAFGDIPPSRDHRQDFTKVHLDRSMSHYARGLDWARLILDSNAPVTTQGDHHGASLLFPMAALFEAFVRKHLGNAVVHPFTLKRQAQGQYLVRHRDENWFRMKPDLLLQHGARNVLVLDTKWKRLDHQQSTRREKYDLSQADLYQLFAYGHSYLNGAGDIVLIYPKTSAFPAPLERFEFPASTGLRLWVLPFCLRTRWLNVPEHAPFRALFS